MQPLLCGKSMEVILHYYYIPTGNVGSVNNIIKKLCF